MARSFYFNRDSPHQFTVGREHTSLSLSDTMQEIPSLRYVKAAHANLPSSIVKRQLKSLKYMMYLVAGGLASRLLRVLAVSANLVAYTANRSNQGLVVSEIHLAAKIVDVHVHDVRPVVKIEFPNLLDNGRPRNRPAFVAN